MERNYKLYVHIAPNGKKYYGITKQKPERRWANGKGYEGNQYFTRAIDKYGWSNIQHIVLHEGLDKEEAGELEQYMIQWYDTANRHYGYNISLGGENSSPTEETKRKMSKAKKGAKNPNYGKYGEKHHCYGKPLSEETKRKLSEANKGKNQPTAKSVICITTGRIFSSVREAGRYYNMSGSGYLSACCKGRVKSAGKSPTGEKLVWKYIDIIEL